MCSRLIDQSGIYRIDDFLSESTDGIRLLISDDAEIVLVVSEGAPSIVIVPIARSLQQFNYPILGVGEYQFIAKIPGPVIEQQLSLRSSAEKRYIRIIGNTDKIVKV